MLRLAFFGSALLLLFAIFSHNIVEFDQDLGRHLLTGKIILETRQVPNTNLFSYTYPDFPFINSHWLVEAVFAAVSQGFGVTSLLYLKVAVMLAAMGLTLYSAYRFSKSLAATAVAFAFFAPVLLERTEIRPEIFSYLLISIFMYILLLKPKLVWFLPILQIFWVNSHIYFILGPILTFIFLRFSPITFLTFAVTLINPNGLTGALYPLQVFNNYGYSIVENQNIFFLREVVFNPNIFYFGIAVLAFAASFLLARFRLPLICYLLATLVALPFIHIRSFPLLFLIELPVFAFTLSRIKFNLKYVLAAVIVLTLLRSYRLVSNQYYEMIGSSKRFGSEIKDSGKGAVDFILANKLHGPIFNNFDIGSYLDYRLYPTEKVFVDGRPEAYPANFFQNLYIPMQLTPENFHTVDALYKFNLISFAHTDATPWGRTFLQNILKNDTFELVYLDDYAIVLVRKEVFPEVTKSISRPKNQMANVDITSLILF